MNFASILSRAWQITWKHKTLWFFGLLASCGAQTGYAASGINFIFGAPLLAESGVLPSVMERFFINLGTYIENLSPDAVVGFTLAIIALTIVAALFFAAISVYGRVTLIKAALLAKAGDSVYWGLLLKQGFAYFFRGLGLNLLLTLALLTVPALFIFVGLFFSLATVGLGFFIFFPLLCLLTPFNLLFNVYIQMANVALVKEDLAILRAARRGWDVMRANWAGILGATLILMIGGSLISLLISLPIAFLAAPLILPAIVGGQNLILSGLVLSGLCFLIGIPILVLANSILRAFIESAWTLTYIELASNTT